MHSQFEHLQYDSMSVTHYEIRFVKLSCYAVFLIPIEIKKAIRFNEGINFEIKLNIDRDTDIETTFQQVVELAQRIKRIRGQGREAVKDKRPPHLG